MSALTPTLSARIVRGVKTNRVRVARRRHRMDEPQADDLEVAPDSLPYKTICISLYHADIDRLKAIVAELKRRGRRRANASWLIRYALAQLDVDAIAPPTPTKET